MLARDPLLFLIPLIIYASNSDCILTSLTNSQEFLRDLIEMIRQLQQLFILHKTDGKDPLHNKHQVRQGY